MFRDLFNFRGINWWTLLGGLGFNVLIVIFVGLGGAYFGVTESTTEFYQRFGAPVIILVIFLACGLSGFITGKLADDVPVKHAFISSLGSAVPLLALGVLALDPMVLMLALVAAAGNLNGGMLSMPRRRHYNPADKR
jgi:fucose 4-O-acetylase-like acetyltransferase